MGEMTHTRLASDEAVNAPADDRDFEDPQSEVDLQFSRLCASSHDGSAEYDPLDGDDGLTHDPRNDTTEVAPAWAEVDA
jgi:hypothetical protein